MRRRGLSEGHSAAIQGSYASKSAGCGRVHRSLPAQKSPPLIRAIPSGDEEQSLVDINYPLSQLVARSSHQYQSTLWSLSSRQLGQNRDRLSSRFSSRPPVELNPAGPSRLKGKPFSAPRSRSHGERVYERFRPRTEHVVARATGRGSGAAARPSGPADWWDAQRPVHVVGWARLRTVTSDPGWCCVSGCAPARSLGGDAPWPDPDRLTTWLTSPWSGRVNDREEEVGGQVMVEIVRCRWPGSSPPPPPHCTSAFAAVSWSPPSAPPS